MTEPTELLACPFCGAQAFFEVDDDRWEWVECESCGMQGNRSASLMESCKPKLAEAWNRRAPVPASGETETCKCCGEGSARIVVRRECDTCTSVYAGVAEHRIQKALAEPPAQEALLNPDMPTQELRLHMGELTTDEVLVARAAIRWANSQQEARVPLDRIARDLLLDVKNRVNALVLLPSSERREGEIRIKQDIADFLAAPQAQEARVPLTSEQQRCIAEAHNVAACEEYFNARPQIDYIANRRIFEAGFSKGYGITAAQKETP